MMPQDNFEKTYEELRQRLELFVQQTDLIPAINDLIVLQQVNEEFNHNPHIAHTSVGLVETVFQNDLEVVHQGIDWYVSYQSHKENQQLQQKRAVVSSEIIRVIELLGMPNTYEQSLAHQKLLTKVNLYFLDPKHYEQFRQLQNLINHKVQYFEKNNQTNQFNEILEQNKCNYQQQQQTLNGLAELHRLSQLNQKQLSELVNNSANKQQAELILQRLADLGINDEKGFLTVIAQNDIVLDKLGQVVTYLEEQKAEKQQLYKQQYKMAQYQGLSDACQFTLAIASYTQSKSLMIAANVAKNSVNITQAIQNILQGSSSGIAILSPYSAIGMAALQIFSLFRSNKNTDINQLILKHIANLSKQIDELRTELSQSKKEILYRMDYYFQSLTNAFNHIENTLTVPAMRQLNDISSDLQTLLAITSVGFNEVLLRDLKDLVNYAQDLDKGICQLDSVSKQEFERNLRTLSQFALYHANHDLFTGRVYAHLLENADNKCELNKILTAAYPTKVEAILGLLFKHAQSVLNIDLKIANEKAIIHPEIWLTAVKTYLQFQAQFRGVYEYDVKNLNTNNFINQADRMITLIRSIQTEPKIYTQLLNKALQCYSQISQRIQEKLENYTEKRKQSVFDNIEVVLDTYQGYMPNSARYNEYAIPKDLKPKSSDQEIFKLKNITEIMYKSGIKIAPEFLLAEKMKLGEFEYQFHAPPQLKKRHHKSEKHGHKYSLKSGNAGIEINFYYQGHHIQLYSTSVIQGKKNFGKLSDTYKYIIKQGTKAVVNHVMIEEIRKSLIATLLNEKKELALEIGNSIEDLTSNLLSQLNWLLCYLHAAGFSKNMHEKTKELIQKVSKSDNYGNYAKNANENILFPIFEEINIKDLKEFKEQIENEVEQIKASNSYRSTLLNYFEVGKQLIYESQMWLVMPQQGHDDYQSQVNKSCYFKAKFKTDGESSSLGKGLNCDV